MRELSVSTLKKKLKALENNNAKQCKTCIYRERIQILHRNSISTVQCCKIQKDSLGVEGMKVIKAFDIACSNYKEQ